MGQEEEILHPLQPIEPYSERLPCLEPIRTSRRNRNSHQAIAGNDLQALKTGGERFTLRYFKMLPFRWSGFRRSQ